MRIGNDGGRAVLITDSVATDVAIATKGEFGPSLASIYERWDAFVAAAKEIDTTGGQFFSPERLGSPAPMPRQVFAIGLNYRSHAAETGMTIPTVPATFTKFPASLSAPFDAIELSSGTVDWEVELVVVIGRRADRVPVESAWGHVAGLSVGQDISDRTLQFAAAGQFSLGKSYRGYGPIGPWLVTLDEFDDPDDLELSCSLNGEVVQRDRTSDMVFTVPQLISELSQVLPLLPGDVIFTGTPAGVGLAHQPPRYLVPGDVLESQIEGIGIIRNTCWAHNTE
ncbi:MAG: fumarylacetoacetate hydrolase family protein [Acidimicrobiales bacterium]|jgi:2-keto-4-pentenoate hydratase/2-oxohepta-3-ene-1,7-dioic acid hydratase in catechol pathway